MFRDEVMDALGIERDWLERYPRELSGGELSGSVWPVLSLKALIFFLPMK